MILIKYFQVKTFKTSNDFSHRGWKYFSPLLEERWNFGYRYGPGQSIYTAYVYTTLWQQSTIRVWVIVVIASNFSAYWEKYCILSFFTNSSAAHKYKINVYWPFFKKEKKAISHYFLSGIYVINNCGAQCMITHWTGRAECIITIQQLKPCTTDSSTHFNTNLHKSKDAEEIRQSLMLYCSFSLQQDTKPNQDWSVDQPFHFYRCATWLQRSLGHIPEPVNVFILFPYVKTPENILDGICCKKKTWRTVQVLKSSSAYKSSDLLTLKQCFWSCSCNCWFIQRYWWWILQMCSSQRQPTIIHTWSLLNSSWTKGLFFYESPLKDG